MSNYFKKRRKRLMEKDPHCHWCGCLLKEYPDYPEAYKHKKMPDDYPTIDHIESRYWGPRPDVGMKQRTLVLSCPKHNHEREVEMIKKHIWRTRWKSASLPWPFRWVNRLLRRARRQKQRNKSFYDKTFKKANPRTEESSDSGDVSQTH